ncbi:MAG: type II secretion system F family protein [Bacilli bacterium]|nr:type II secretion system F family protein [Bacilli bacterium]
MNDVATKKINPFLFPFLNIYYILLNAFNGFVFVFFRLPVILYEMTSFRVDSTYKKFKGDNMKTGANNQPLQNAPKKIYKYSDATLQKMANLRAQLLKELETENFRSKVPILYYYKGMNSDGKIETGTMYGYSKVDVNTFLVNDGYEVYIIKTSKWIQFAYGDTGLFKSKMSVKDLIFWLTQLKTYLKAGITLSESLRILSKQMGKKDKGKQRAFKAISYELSLGENFSAALEKQGNMFPALLINMIKAAEATGTLIETLEDMMNYYTEIDKTRKQMISAMTYPSIIMIFAIGVITFILVFVIPEFVGIYESADAEITGLTKFVIDASKFLSANGLYILLGLVVVILVLFLLYKGAKSFRSVVQSLLMRIPVIGNIIIYNEITIFTKTFASLLKNNVFITDSMEILSKITNNEIYKDIMYNTINNIVVGNKISDSFKDHWAIPDVAYYMIVTGESTGELAEMMQKVSEYFQEMHRNIVNSLKSFIEPIMITSLALIVGVIILAVIVPMFGMYENI